MRPAEQPTRPGRGRGAPVRRRILPPVSRVSTAPSRSPRQRASEVPHVWSVVPAEPYCCVARARAGAGRCDGCRCAAAA
jgi:hypothetical protein